MALTCGTNLQKSTWKWERISFRYHNNYRPKCSLYNATEIQSRPALHFSLARDDGMKMYFFLEYIFAFFAAGIISHFNFSSGLTHCSWSPVHSTRPHHPFLFYHQKFYCSRIHLFVSFSVCQWICISNSGQKGFQIHFSCIVKDISEPYSMHKTKTSLKKQKKWDIGPKVRGWSGSDPKCFQFFYDIRESVLMKENSILNISLT